MLGQSVIPKQIEEIKSKDRFLQDKTYFYLAVKKKSAMFDISPTQTIQEILCCHLKYMPKMPSLGKGGKP